MAPASLLATLTGNLYLILATPVFALAALALAWMPPRGRPFFAVARAWSRGLLAASGVRLEVERAGGLEPHRRYIFMSNHESLYDIPALIASLPVPARFLAKRSLFRIPVFGWALRAGGFITIDREDRSRMREAFAKAVAQLESGGSVLVFPEGTRSLDGRIAKFQRGGFLLALRGGIAIVPVGLSGTLAVQRKGSRRIRPGTVGVRFGRPIETAELGVSGKGPLMERVRREIASLADREAA